MSILNDISKGVFENNENGIYPKRIVVSIDGYTQLMDSLFMHNQKIQLEHIRDLMSIGVPCLSEINKAIKDCEEHNKPNNAHIIELTCVYGIPISIDENQSEKFIFKDI